MDPKELHYETLAKTVISNLEKRNMEADRKSVV